MERKEGSEKLWNVWTIYLIGGAVGGCLGETVTYPLFLLLQGKTKKECFWKFSNCAKHSVGTGAKFCAYELFRENQQGAFLSGKV